MNQVTTNCILFIVITYVLTCIVAWSLPPLYVISLATLIPATIAILLTVYNKQSVKDLFKLSSLKNCSLGFVIVLVARIIAFLLTILVFTFVQVEEYTYTLKNVKNFGVVGTLFFLLFLFAMQTVFSLGEEIGWRGYLLKNLKNQIPNFYARAIVVGFVWAIWHIPIYTVPGSAESAMFSKDGFTLPIICIYILLVCTMSIIFTWLFEKDNSVWPVSIAHTTNNFIVSIFMLFTAAQSSISTSTAVIAHIILTIAYLIVATGIILFEKTQGRRLSNS